MRTLRACLRGFGSAIALAALAGCGGGGSSPGPGPGATAPAPTPSPTATATPTPSPSYGLAHDYTVDADFPGWGVRLVADYTAPPTTAPPGTPGTTRFSAEVVPETRAAGFVYTAAQRSYIARWFDDTRTFAPAVSSIFQNSTPIDAVTGAFLRSAFRPAPGVQDYTRHTGYIAWEINSGNGNALFSSQSRRHNAVYGFPTQPNDLPTSGSNRYDMVFFGLNWQPNYIVGSDKLLLTVDWASGAISGTYTIDPVPNAPPNTPQLVFAVAGTVDPGSSRLVGTISGSGYSGTLRGAVFGPRAKEIAFAFSAANTSNGVIAGVAGASR